MDHNLIPSHSFKLDLNNFPFCTLRLNEAICDPPPHILFACPAPDAKRHILINPLESLNVSFDLHSIVDTLSEMYYHYHFGS